MKKGDEMTIIEKVRVIGDDGAFDTEKVNSSFLISINEPNNMNFKKFSILYDCEHNVFSRLLELEKNRI